MGHMARLFSPGSMWSGVAGRGDGGSGGPDKQGWDEEEDRTKLWAEPRLVAPLPPLRPLSSCGLRGQPGMHCFPLWAWPFHKPCHTGWNLHQPAVLNPRQEEIQEEENQARKIQGKLTQKPRPPVVLTPRTGFWSPNSRATRFCATDFLVELESQGNPKDATSGEASVGLQALFLFSVLT